MVWLVQLVLRSLRLILPVIFPSWRFFKEIEPSPRLESRVGEGPWVPAVQRPARLGPGRAVVRLVWNRDWNEHLFLVSCCERLIVAPSQHSVDEIVARQCRALGCSAHELSFRISLAVRAAGQITLHSVYESRAPHVLRPRAPPD